MFAKGHDLFPIKERYAFLSYCGIAPLYAPAVRALHELAQEQCLSASLVFRRYDATLDALRTAAGQVLRTASNNVAFVKNTTEGISLIANGYPFRSGDEVVSYIHEYPANHYPWKLQERRGVKLVLLPDRDVTGSAPEGRPVAWTMADLEACVTPRTRIVALSHVQFASGYTADLAALSAFCKARDIDLVLDVAQSFGCLPVYPDEHGIAAVVSSGWKWLMGPMGTGLFYTSERFRHKLEPVMVGAETMRQGTDYLDHAWAPHASAKRFEYSTAPLALAAALECCLRELPLRYGLEAIAEEIFRLQAIFLHALNRARFRPVFEHRSPIISLLGPGNANELARALLKKNVICTARGGYLRIAPHFCTTDDEAERAASALNAIGT